MESPASGYKEFDSKGYVSRSIAGPCFVCAFLDGDPEYPHHDVYEDDFAIAFLARYPRLLGHCLVAPKRHVEDWALDLSEDEFLALQRIIRNVGRAVQLTLPTERLYSLSLGSKSGNAHLHWHVAPLPPGVPYEQQQFFALMSENGVLEIDIESMAALAAQIKSNL